MYTWQGNSAVKLSNVQRSLALRLRLSRHGKRAVLGRRATRGSQLDARHGAEPSGGIRGHMLAAVAPKHE